MSFVKNPPYVVRDLHRDPAEQEQEAPEGHDAQYHAHVDYLLKCLVHRFVFAFRLKPIVSDTVSAFYAFAFFQSSSIQTSSAGYLRSRRTFS